MIPLGWGGSPIRYRSVECRSVERGRDGEAGRTVLFDGPESWVAQDGAVAAGGRRSEVGGRSSRLRCRGLTADVPPVGGI